MREKEKLKKNVKVLESQIKGTLINIDWCLVRKCLHRNVIKYGKST